MKLSKTSCIFFGLGIMLLIYVGTRLFFIVGSETITGKFAFYIEEVIKEEKVTFPIIEYSIKDSTYQFRAKENTEYQEGETVPVLLINNDPDWPKLYDLNSFWLFPLFYFLLPALIWVSFAASYIGKNEVIHLNVRKPFVQKIKKS